MNGHDLCDVNSLKSNIMADVKQVTIGDAQSWYGRADGIVRASALRDIMGVMIQRNVKTEFENDSYFDALMFSEMMFDRSNQSISLFTGSGCEAFLQTLHRSFYSALDRLKNSGGSVRMITTAEHVSEFLMGLQKRYPETLSVAPARANEVIGHFFICDSRMARVEQPHGPLTPETPVDAIKAKVFFNHPAVAQMLEIRFNAFWRAVQPVPKV